MAVQPPDSMQSGALKALEFDRIVEAVCRLAQTPPGAEQLARLHPLNDADAVAVRAGDDRGDGALSVGYRTDRAARAR